MSLLTACGELRCTVILSVQGDGGEFNKNLSEKKKKNDFAAHHTPFCNMQMNAWLTFNDTMLLQEGGRARQGVWCCGSSWGGSRRTCGRDVVTRRWVLTPISVDLHVQKQFILSDTPEDKRLAQMWLKSTGALRGSIYAAGYVRTGKRPVGLLKQSWHKLASDMLNTWTRGRALYFLTCIHMWLTVAFQLSMIWVPRLQVAWARDTCTCSVEDNI